MAKGAREKIVTSQSKGHLAKEQRLKDTEARVAVKKGGGRQHPPAEAEQAEVASYRLNKRSKF